MKAIHISTAAIVFGLLAAPAGAQLVGNVGGTVGGTTGAIGSSAGTSGSTAINPRTGDVSVGSSLSSATRSPGSSVGATANTGVSADLPGTNAARETVATTTGDVKRATRKTRRDAVETARRGTSAGAQANVGVKGEVRPDGN